VRAEPAGAARLPAAKPAGRRDRRSPQRALIVGAGPAALRLAQELERGGRYHVLGFVAREGPIASAAVPRMVVDPLPLAELVATYGVDDLFVARESEEATRLAVELLAARDQGAQLHLLPDLALALVARPTRRHAGDLALLAIGAAPHGPLFALGKRWFDIVFSLVALLLTTPLLLLAALAIRWESPGPILFRQERVGRDGRRFFLYKLRTMIDGAEALSGPGLCAGLDDPRLTRVGRFLRRTCLDELPQFWNVLRGEMSVVGPRPERPCFVERYEREIPGYGERHRVRPGITGLAQVCGYYASSAAEKLRFDLIYLYNPSVAMEGWILLATLLRATLR